MRDDSEIDFSGFQIEDTPPLEVIPRGFLPEESPLADDESLDFSGFSETQDSPFGGSLVAPSLLEVGSTPSSLAAKAKALGLPASAAQTHPTEVADESRRVSEGWDSLRETHPALGKAAQDPETSYLVKDHISPLKSFLDAASRFWNGQRGEDKELSTALSAYTGSATNTAGSALKGAGEMYDSVLTILDTNMRHSLGPKWDLVRANIESLTSGVDVSQIMKPGGVLRATLPHERAGGQAVFGSESLSYPTVDETLEALGSAVQEFSKETFYQADDKSPALYRITSGLGSLSSQVLVSAVNPTAGALMLVALGADSQAQELESNTDISAHSRATAVIAGGAATMATTVPAIDRLLAKTKDLAKSAGASWTVDLIQAGLYNAVSEVADKGLQNKITGAATGEAPDLKIDDQFVVDTLVGMFTRGTVRSYEAVSSRKDQEESRGADAKALADALQQSGMAQESPEAFRSLVDDAFPNQQMYFSRESLQDVVDTMPSSRLSGVLQSAIDSSEPGERVRLPPSAVLAADVPPEALGRLLQEARPSADADEVGTSVADMLRAAASRAAEVRDAEAIMQEVLPQLQEATRLNAREAQLLAQVIPQWAASKARREGKSPAQVMEESELVIGSDTKDPRSFSQETEVSPFKSVSAEEFSTKIEEFRALGGRNRDVTAKTVEELQGAKMFLADEGRVGFAVMPDGEIASSFKFPGSSMKGALTEITRLAEKEGGSYRVVFDGPLIDIHRKNGWEVTERLEFDDQYAPEGWDFEERGRPDVLTLRRDGQKLNQGVSVTRGWYSPSRRLIALTSAESRTTFMHEMAHFMLDMETPNSPLHKAVREWLSRKGLDDFLEEAVRYDRGLTESLNGEPNSRYSPEVVAMAKGGADFAGYVTFDRGGVPSREGLLELPPDADLIDVTDIADKGLSDDAVAAYMEEAIPGAIVTIGGQKAYVVWDPRFVSQGDIARQRLLTGDAREYASNSVPGSTLTPLGARRYLLDGTSGDTGHDVAYLTAMHEKFARGFEEYLREGKSPSPEMDAAFLEASRWASDLYGDGESLTAGLDTQMRETLTALITVPEQVEARARFAGVEELFPSAKEADMSPSQFSQYQEERDQILAKAEKTVREKIESNIAATMKREYRRAVAEAEARIFEEIANDPVHVAVREIRENYPLDANAIKELVGEDYTTKDGDVVKAIPMKLLGLTRRGGIGHHPDVIAAAFGFESGQQMLRAIMDSKTQRQEARDRAEEEVKSSKGELPTQDEVAKMVAETVDGSVSEELILLQLRAMNRSPAQKELAEMRAKAKERIREIPLEEASAARYRASAAKEAKAAAREMRKGNRKAAEKHKRQQLVMSLMEKEAVRAHEKADKITARLSVYSKQKAATQLANRFPAGYWGVKGLLQQFNLGKVADIEGLPGTVVPLPLLENQLLREWGVAIDVPEAARTGEFPSPSQLTLNHLLSVEESVKSIEHAAKRLESYGKDASAKKVDDVVKALQDSQDGIRKVQNLSDGPDSDLTTPSKWEKARKHLNDFISIQTKIPWMLRWMDGGGRAGLWYQTFAKPFVEAYRNADLLTRLVVTPMATALRERSSEDVKRHNTRHTFKRPDGSSITLETHRILNLALHMGTLSGRRKVQEGHRLLSSGEDPESIGALTAQMLDVLTEKDWDLVKTYWQQLELLAKPLSEQHLRDTGREMTREEAAPFLTKFGEMPGGYAPLFKKRTLEDMVGSAEEDAGSMFEGSNFYNDIGVDTGARLDRTHAVYEVDLDLNRIAQHVRQVVHYVTHRDAVVDVNRLLRDPRVEKMVRERLGDSDWEQFRPWLVDIAKDGRAAGADTAFDKTLSYLKNGTTIAVMGYRASTMAMQFLGLSNAAAEVGPLNLGKVVAKMSTSPSYLKEATAFAMENSRVLGTRVKDYDRDVASALRNVDGSNEGALAAVRGGAFLPLAYVQLHAVDIPTWVAAYTKAIKAGDSQAVAVDYADFAVEQIHGSGKKMNSAALMRSGKAPTQIFTMFMTFFSSLFNASRDLGVRFKDGNMSAFDVAGSALLMYAIPVALEMLIRGEVSEDDEDDMLEFGVNLFTYPLASVVGVRDLASAPHILGAITGDRVQFGQSISPVSQILGDTVAVAKVAGSLVSDNDVEPHEAKAAVRALGAWMQLPTGQLVSSTDYLLKRAQEGEDFSVRQFFIGADRQK